MSDVGMLVDGPHDGQSVEVPYVQGEVWIGDEVYVISNLFPLEYKWSEAPRDRG